MNALLSILFTMAFILLAAWMICVGSTGGGADITTLACLSAVGFCLLAADALSEVGK